jgi:hypothetical protein
LEFLEETMMTRMMRGMVVMLSAAVVGGLIEWGPTNGLTSIAEAKPKGPKGDKGPKKGKDHLQKTYEDLTDVIARTEGRRSRPPRELEPLINQAKDLYRDAVRAVREEEPERAEELAAAAHDAARGLVHAVRADTASVRDIPAPPRRDEDELDDVLRRIGERLKDRTEETPRGPGRAFSDAARRFYDQARKAEKDDPERAFQLARAAEAWTHVGEHLSRADNRGARRPQPERRREQPRPPRRPDREGPPPPPRDRD